MYNKDRILIFLICIFTLLIAFSQEANSLDPAIHIKLNKLERATGCDLKINSGDRSRSHNKAVGGVPNSYHIRNKAIDVGLLKACGKSLRWIAKKATKYFRGVILYKTHIHLDIRQSVYHNIK